MSARLTVGGRRRGSVALIALSLVAAGLVTGCTPAADESRSMAGDPVFDIPNWTGRWYKGNTHAHTTNSDGDSSPEYVAQWYKDNGYHDKLITSEDGPDGSIDAALIERTARYRILLED